MTLCSFRNACDIVVLAAAARIPAIYGARDFVVDGGLVSYGVSLSSSARPSPATSTKFSMEHDLAIFQ